MFSFFEVNKNYLEHNNIIMFTSNNNVISYVTTKDIYIKNT